MSNENHLAHSRRSIIALIIDAVFSFARTRTPLVQLVILAQPGELFPINCALRGNKLSSTTHRSGDNLSPRHTTLVEHLRIEYVTVAVVVGNVGVISVTGTSSLCKVYQLVFARANLAYFIETVFLESSAEYLRVSRLAYAIDTPFPYFCHLIMHLPTGTIVMEIVRRRDGSFWKIWRGQVGGGGDKRVLGKFREL